MRHGMNATDEQFRRYIEDLMEGVGTEPRSQAFDMDEIDYGGIEDVPDGPTR